MVVFCGMNSKSRSPFSYQKTVTMTLSADFSTLKFLGLGEVLCFHCMDSILYSENLWYTQVSSPDTKRWKKCSGSSVSSSKFSWQHWRRVCFWKVLSILGTHLALTLDMYSFSWIMVQTAPAEMPVYSDNLDTFIRLFSTNKLSNFWHNSSEVASTWRPVWGSFSIDSLPHLNCLLQNFTL